jgi:hypothetical protein
VSEVSVRGSMRQEYVGTLDVFERETRHSLHAARRSGAR